MKITRRDGLKFACGAALAAGPLAAFAESHGAMNVVEMLNKGPDGNDRQVFNPPVLQVAEGESVMFKATDRGHNSAADEKMMPEGAEAWKGKIGQDIEVTFDVPGVYGYYCTPHRSVGMVGLILVGEVSQSDLDAAKEVPQRGKAKDRYETYFAMAEEMVAST